jgi:hypothetical protein
VTATQAARASRRTVAVRVVFAAAVLTLPAQMLVRQVVAEPYPGLYQPSFGGVPQQGDAATTLEPEITVHFADGRTEAWTSEDVLPPTPVLENEVMRKAFTGAAPAQDPETLRWLRDRILARSPGSDPASVVIAWQEVEYDFVTGDRTVVDVSSIVTMDVGSVG